MLQFFRKSAVPHCSDLKPFTEKKLNLKCETLIFIQICFKICTCMLLFSDLDKCIGLLCMLHHIIMGKALTFVYILANSLALQVANAPETLQPKYCLNAPVPWYRDQYQHALPYKELWWNGPNIDLYLYISYSRHSVPSPELYFHNMKFYSFQRARLKPVEVIELDSNQSSLS